MKYRVKRRLDGKYYPQVKSFLFWKDMTYTVYPAVSFIGSFEASIFFENLEDAIDHLITHESKVYEYRNK